MDLDENKLKADLWLVRMDGTGLRRLTSHEKGSSSPQWSPDGKSILFLSARGESSQVWGIAADGGEAAQVTDEPLDIDSFKPSPDGRLLALSMEVFPGRTPDETKEELDSRKDGKPSGQVYDQLFIRHWDTWKDGRRSHLFIHTIETGKTADLMTDADADVPTKPFGGAEDYVFSPDGTYTQAIVDPGAGSEGGSGTVPHIERTDGTWQPRSAASRISRVIGGLGITSATIIRGNRLSRFTGTCASTSG